MVTKYDYGKSEVEACLSVLVELMTILGEFRDHIVLTGGWVSYFLVEERRHEHVGSLDIDSSREYCRNPQEERRVCHRYREGIWCFLF
jgi:hypothetical protein